MSGRRNGEKLSVPRGLKIAVAALAGVIVGEAIAIFGYVLATNYFGLFDRDGGGAMGASSFWGHSSRSCAA